jgi:hypothetical protein
LDGRLLKETPHTGPASNAGQEGSSIEKHSKRSASSILRRLFDRTFSVPDRLSPIFNLIGDHFFAATFHK